MDRSLYTRPAKPLRVRSLQDVEAVRVRALPTQTEPMIVDAATECHVTPPTVAARMADALGSQPPRRVLEPSAGTGNLINALATRHSASRIVAVERHATLAAHLRDTWSKATIVNACFIEWAASTSERFTHILMNPPFRGVRRHMDAALSLLDASADAVTLVALVPITYAHEEAETIEELPQDTFETCAVHTKVVRISR